MAWVLIVGASSDIAKCVARRLAAEGFDLYLAARAVEEVTSLADDISVRTGRRAEVFGVDILDTEAHAGFYEGLPEPPEGVVCAVGYLGDQRKAQSDFSEAKKIIDTNFTGIVSLLNIVANDFEKRRRGFIVGISSVAGDRGRQSNYIYGAAKGAFSIYLSGLRNRLHRSGVHVVTVKPGFVRTKMTEGMDLPPRLTADPDEVAKDIVTAIKKQKDIVYSKKIWWMVMLVIKSMPEFMFKRMGL